MREHDPKRAREHEPKPAPGGQDTGDQDTPVPVPNRRERRGGKSRDSTPHGGPSRVGHRPPPVVNARQYSTRRRSG